MAHLQCDLDLAAQSVRAKISRTWDQGHSSHSDDLICQLTIDSSDRIVSVINGREFFAVEHLAAYILEYTIFESMWLVETRSGSGLPVIASFVIDVTQSCACRAE